MKRHTRTTGAALSFALVAFAGCEPQPEAEEEMEQAGEAVEEAAQHVAAAFEDVDVDADGVVDEENWRGWWGDVDWFSNWDLNANGHLNENELRTGVQGTAFGEDVDADLFAQWDTDGDQQLAEEELQNGLFDWLDGNDNGKLSGDEWQLEGDA